MASTLSRMDRVARKPVQPGSLRAQFALVISLLSFLPNLVIVLVLIRLTGMSDLGLILGWMLLVALVSGGVGYALSLALLRPLTRLTRELDDGQVDVPHADDPTEVGSLRGAFTRLLGRLSQERDRRNAFMATLVHDLKTPLIATSHLVSVLRDVPLHDADRADIARQLLAENERLLQLVQQMADAHRFEREGVIVHRQPLVLRALGERLTARFAGRAEERGLRLHVECAEEAYADEAQLDRALSNLLENALRYANGEVRLELGAGAARVRDDGPGLARPLHELVQPFNAQPVVIAGHRYTAGTAGLGLFIAQRIGQAHGGDLEYARVDGHTVFELRYGGSSLQAHEEAACAS